MVHLPPAVLRRAAAPGNVELSSSLSSGARDLTRREATQTCDAEGNCTIPTHGLDTSTIAIALGVIIPVVVAVGVLVFLHRRHLRKLRQEDKEDKHGSLDFGLDAVPAKARMARMDRSPNLAVSDLEKDIRSGKGMSLDMVGSPYILPATLHSSRDSFHSMSKQDPHDPYRPVGFVKDDTGSLRLGRGDNASVYTRSSANTERPDAHLLRYAQSNPRSLPPRAESMMNHDPYRESTQTHMTSPSAESSHANSMSSPPTSYTNSLAPSASQLDRDSYFAKTAKDMSQSNKYLANMIRDRPPSDETKSDPSSPPSRAPTLPSVELEMSNHPPELEENYAEYAPPRTHSLEAAVHTAAHQRFASGDSDYGDAFKVTPPSPLLPQHPARSASLSNQAPVPFSSEEEDHLSAMHEYHYDAGFGNRRLSILRPLPPDEPMENPEERANRIRSFYKEYFDETKPDPEGRYHSSPYFDQGYANDYYEDYGSEYLNEGTVFDPSTGAFVVTGQHAFAEPITRRAMTPPPRAPPRFRGGPPHGILSPRYPSASSGFSSPNLRSHSAMGANRRPMPPPAPLTSLPTPHLLKEDSMVFNPIDFAPPSTFRDRQAGRRPDSPMGTARPYSPAVRAHTPLASSFDDLAIMPSPHHLRKSGIFTALDFAPPRRFREADMTSDAGSIRSNHSNMSRAQLGALRAGAYRVSRIPKEVVGTRDDITNALRPTWDQRGVNPGSLLGGR